MTMTDKDIVYYWRYYRGEFPAEAIRTLAVINKVSEEEIKKILIKYKAMKEEKPVRNYKKRTAEEKETVKQLYKERKSKSEIQQLTGVPKSTIRNILGADEKEKEPARQDAEQAQENINNESIPQATENVNTVCYDHILTQLIECAGRILPQAQIIDVSASNKYKYANLEFEGPNGEKYSISVNGEAQQ